VSLLRSALLADHPLTDVRRTIPQLDAARFAVDEEAHDPEVNQRHLVQVEQEWRLVPSEMGLELF
jgi:hypothetical protein